MLKRPRSGYASSFRIRIGIQIRQLNDRRFVISVLLRESAAYLTVVLADGAVLPVIVITLVL